MKKTHAGLVAIAFVLGIAVAVLLGAATAQQAPMRYHGFATTKGDWVVVDGFTGDACRFYMESNPELIGRVLDAITADPNRTEAQRRYASERVIDRIECRWRPR